MLLLALASHVLVVGCTTDKNQAAASNDMATGPGGAAGDGALAGDGGSTASVLPIGDCSAGLPTADEIASTPRDDTNLELLALRFSTGVVADQRVYDRLVRDITAIRELDESLSDVAYYAQDHGQDLLLELTPTAFEDVRAGRYHAWDCLNETYVLASTDMTLFSPYVVVSLKGIYALEKVAAQYAELPGVMSAGPDEGGGDGSTICVTQELDTWHYVFDRAGGDCPAGCTTHAYSYFTTDVDGTVTVIGRPSAAEIGKYASREACHR